MKSIYLVLIFILFSNILNSQILINDNIRSSIIIQGTSNIYNWKSKTTNFNVSLVLNSNNIDEMNVDISVKSIKSGDKIIDNKTYETFNADKYPKIYLKLLSVEQFKITEKNVNIIFNGNLTISGVTRKITIKCIGRKLKDNSYNFTGYLSIKMTDFNMTPPTLLLGAVKVGDEIKLFLNIYLIKN